MSQVLWSQVENSNKAISHPSVIGGTPPVLVLAWEPIGETGGNIQIFEKAQLVNIDNLKMYYVNAAANEINFDI